MPNKGKTAIVTGASQGIGAGLVTAFLERGYNVVGSSRNSSKSTSVNPSEKVALVDGDIGEASTAKKIAETAVSRFGSIDALVNNAGIYFSKPFLEYTTADLRALLSTNIEGFLHITQLAVKQMLLQNTGGSIVNITTTMVDHPIAGVPSTVAMITKGGLQSAALNLAMEYAKQGIRVNVVAPGAVNTPMHKDSPKDALRKLQPMGGISEVQDIVDAVMYLMEARQVTGEVLHVDGGAHLGKW